MNSSTKQLLWLFLIIGLVSCAPQQGGASETHLSQKETPISSTYTPTSTATPSPTVTATTMPYNCEVIIGCPLNPLPTDSPATKTAVQQMQVTKYVNFDFSKIAKIFRIAISPDGKKIAVSSENGIWFYDVETQNLLWKAEPTKSTSKIMIFPIAWSPDGNILASGFSNGEIELWNIHLRKRISHFPINGASITNLAWSHDGKLLASTSMVEGDWDHGLLKVWNVGTQQSVLTLPIDNGFAWNIDFSPDNFFIALTGVQGFHYPKGLGIWEVKSGKEHVLNSYGTQINEQDNFQTVSFHSASTFPSPAYAGCTGLYGVRWSPDGKRLITLEGCFSVLTIWNVESGQKEYSLETRGMTGIWSSNGKYLAFDEYPDSIQISLAETGKTVYILSCPSKKEVPQFEGTTAGDMVWSSANNNLLAVNLDGELCSWLMP